MHTVHGNIDDLRQSKKHKRVCQPAQETTSPMPCRAISLCLGPASMLIKGRQGPGQGDLFMRLCIVVHRQSCILPLRHEPGRYPIPNEVHVGADVISHVLVSGIVRLGREGVQSVAHEPVIRSFITYTRNEMVPELSPFVAYCTPAGRRGCILVVS
jgi:hypothetical protein